jgi:hypothetical protein
MLASLVTNESQARNYRKRLTLHNYLYVCFITANRIIG